MGRRLPPSKRNEPPPQQDSTATNKVKTPPEHRPTLATDEAREGQEKEEVVPGASGAKYLPDAGSNGTQNVDEIKRVVQQDMVSLTTSEAKKDVAAGVMQTLPPEAKKELATEAMQTLLPEDKRNAVINAARALPPAHKKDVAEELARELSPPDRQDLASRLPFLVPTQRMADWIWLTIVMSFAIVFVLSSIGLIFAIYWNLQQMQVLLTVITTVAGILAGFISGRASTGETRP